MDKIQPMKKDQKMDYFSTLSAELHSLLTIPRDPLNPDKTIIG